MTQEANVEAVRRRLIRRLGEQPSDPESERQSAWTGSRSHAGSYGSS